MRFGSAMAMSCAAAVCSWILAPAHAQSAAGPVDVTFELTSLTSSDLHLQHGIENYVTLTMKEVASSKAVSIEEPPPFPLIATLHYFDREGVERKATSTCDYRC